VLEALQASGAYRATSLDTPHAGGNATGDTLADTVASTEQGFGRAEDRATLAKLLRAITVLPPCAAGTAGPVFACSRTDS
jgi:hypothetical protein